MTGFAATQRPDLETTLDFINTTEIEHGAQVDHLDTTRAALDWLQEHVGIDRARVPEADAARTRIVRSRTAFRELWDAAVEGRPPAESAVREINRVLRDRTRLEIRAEVDARGSAVYRLDRRSVGDPIDCALADLAEPLALALGTPDSIARARVCASETCRWVFYDDSPTHRRRWCDMASCGNRAKAARHRARAKAGTTAAQAVGDAPAG